MTKIEFLLQLEKQLAGLPEADLLRTMDYYNEIIDDRAEDMGSETEAVAAMGTPEDIAHLAVFLASEKASFITGQVITADGGFIV